MSLHQCKYKKIIYRHIEKIYVDQKGSNEYIS